MARQLLTDRLARRTTKPAAQIRSLSSSSSYTQVFPISGAVMITIWRQ